MTAANLYCLVMAGGMGTRFWPESTVKKPKQYLNLIGEKSLLAETLDRFDGLIDKDNRYIVTVKDQEQLVNEAAKGAISDKGVIFEPAGRNTAPCILLSLASLLESGAKPTDAVAIVPSDHVILNHQGFRDVIAEAVELASENKKIVTIGIPPTFPHTGYGYIQKGGKASDNAFDVDSFKEKPDFETAKEYVASGSYFWNAGMFVATLETLLREFEAHSPDTFAHLAPLRESIGDADKLFDAYGKIPRDSIDYAVMEKSKEVMVLPARFDWNDLGSWDALESVIEAKNNNVVGKARDVFCPDSKGNIIYAPDKFVSLVNVNDLIVVSGEQSVLVVPKSDAQRIREVVQHLKDNTELNDLL